MRAVAAAPWALGYEGGRSSAPRVYVHLTHRHLPAAADGFIEAFPDGYATLVGERGVLLGAGQK